MEIKIDKIIKSKRKTLAIEINSYGNVIVRTPLKIDSKTISKILEKKSSWIEKSRKKILQNQTPRKKFENGEYFLFLGEKFELNIKEQKEKLIFDNEKLLLSENKKSSVKQVLTNWYKEKALEIFKEKIERLSYQYNFKYAKMKVSSANRQWGSCNAKNNISLTWRLIMAPNEIIDYVIIHELVHTKIKNHSKTFWTSLENIIPDYKIRRKWLKTKGQTLNL